VTPATVMLVHGPCGTPAAWSRVVPFLDRAGVPSVVPHLPSCLPEAELDDAAFLRSVLDGCDGRVVPVGHSGGGFPITEVGEHPAVKHLVYLDAALPDAGETLGDLLEPGDVDAGFSACIKRHPGGVAFDTVALAAHLRDWGWPADEAQEFVAGFVPARTAALVRVVTTATWRSVPSTFIACMDSQMGPKPRARFGSRATDVIEMPGDHFPNWRRPADVADIIGQIARDAVTR
jgi:pimeloyl-ACP methyl ester carboxylesterase